VYQKYNGDLSLARLTHYCWEEGVWTAEEQHNMAFATATRECQRVLNQKGVTGLPVAGPTKKYDNGDRRWRQLSLWDYDDAIYNLGMRLRQTVERDWQTIIVLHTYIQERYGQAPAIPQWEMPPNTPLWWRDLDDGNGHDEDEP